MWIGLDWIGLDGLDWILLRSLVLLEHLAVLIKAHKVIVAGQSHSAVFKLFNSIDPCFIHVYRCFNLWTAVLCCQLLFQAYNLLFQFFKLPMSPTSFNIRLFKAANICFGLLTNV